MIDRIKIIAAVALVIAGVAAFYIFADWHFLLRVAAVIVGVIAGAGLALTTEPGQAAWQFATGARTEVRKVIWPTQRETVQATGVVILMVIAVGLYLWALDGLSFWVIYDLVLGIDAG